MIRRTHTHTHDASISQLIDNDSLPFPLSLSPSFLPLYSRFRPLFLPVVFAIWSFLLLIKIECEFKSIFKNNFSRNFNLHAACRSEPFFLFRWAIWRVEKKSMKQFCQSALSDKMIFPFNIGISNLYFYNFSKMTSIWSCAKTLTTTQQRRRQQQNENISVEQANVRMIRAHRTCQLNRTLLLAIEKMMRFN